MARFTTGERTSDILGEITLTASSTRDATSPALVDLEGDGNTNFAISDFEVNSFSTVSSFGGTWNPWNPWLPDLKLKERTVKVSATLS